MVRDHKHYKIEDVSGFLSGLIHWVYTQDYFSFFNGNNYKGVFGVFPVFAAAGALKKCIPDSEDPFGTLKSFYESEKDWMAGRFNYDLKNRVENLSSGNTDRLGSEEMAFFIPETLIFLRPGGVDIHSVYDPDKIFDELMNIEASSMEPFRFRVDCDTTIETYIKNVRRIKDQIVEGDFYELNYCLEFFSSTLRPDLASVYLRLNEISPMPFSVFQGIKGQYILSASPERFLKKTDRTLIAQPIKGTMRRDPDPGIDAALAHQLRHSEKEVAENMMIVDLMRNDLGRSAVTGSIKVPEMFGIYSFSHVHQMISTITAELRSNVHFIDAIRNAFPMGSMTGAPKIRVMEAIERYENSRRGMFSGAAGFITPEGNFDFNVLIRSIFYSDRTGILKFNAGSAITYDADPEYEHSECLLKTRPMTEALGLPEI